MLNYRYVDDGQDFMLFPSRIEQAEAFGQVRDRAASTKVLELKTSSSISFGGSSGISKVKSRPSIHTFFSPSAPPKAIELL